MHEESEKVRLVESLEVHAPDEVAATEAVEGTGEGSDRDSHQENQSTFVAGIDPDTSRLPGLKARLERRRASRKKKRKPMLWFLTGVVAVGIGAAGVGYYASLQSAQPPSLQPDYGTVAPSGQSQEPPSNPFNWFSLNPFGWMPSSSSIHNLNRLSEDLSKPLDWLAKFAAFAGVGFWLYSIATKRRYVQFDNLGLLFTESSKGQSGAKFIPWACIDEVEVRHLKGFDIQSLEQKAQKADPNSNPLIVFHVDDHSTVKIRWQDITACVEPGSFINALKTYAPAASEKYQFPGEVGKVDSNSYTQLWFKYYSTASDRKRTTHLVEGEQLQNGRYTVAGQIGGGGQGTAYLAVDRDAPEGAKTEIVLKEYILPVHRGERILKQTVEKLEQEAAILRMIDQPNIVKMLDCFVEDHRGYLVMEYVQGRSLKDLVQREGPQPEHVVADIAVQVTDVLAYLHGLTPPVVHRDLTPDNLILQDDGLVKLVDFNVAHQLESAATATVVGKHCYIPPEQFRGRPTIQSDIYAFGGTLQYLLTGEDPEPLSVSRPTERNERVSGEFSAIVAKATALDATKRFANVHDMRRELDELDKLNQDAAAVS